MNDKLKSFIGLCKQLFCKLLSLFKGILYTMIVCGMWSCEEIVNPDLVSLPEPIISIDGWLVNRPEESRVILSRSAPFNSDEPNPRISGAVVRIDDLRNRVFFQEDEQEAGVYVPIGPDFTVRPRNTYTLIVNIQSQQYEAKLAVTPIREIDSLTYEFFPQSTTQEEGYYLSFYFQDPITTKNYYYWEVFKNGELISDQEIHITDDATVNGTNIEIELTDYPFQLQDEAEVRLHTITKETFEYYQALKLLVDAGSPAQSVPENPISNIRDVSNDAQSQVVGYFNATLSSSMSILIEE